MNPIKQPIKPPDNSLYKQRSTPSKLTKKEYFFSRLFLLLPLLVVTRLTILVRQRSGSEYASVDGMAVVQIALIAIIALLILIAPRLKWAWRQCKESAIVFFVFFYFIAMGSALWSALPQYTLYRAVEFLCLLYSIYLALLYSNDYYSAEKKAIYASLLVILLGVAKHIKLSGLSLSALHTNSYSASAAMLFCYCLGEYFSATKKRKQLLRNVGIVALVFLIIGTSSASYIATLFGLTIISLLYKNKLLLAFTVCCFLTIFLTLSAEEITGILFPGKTNKTIISMTGRNWIWQMYFDMIMEKPLLGYGFASSTRMAGHYMTNTHNGFIAVILGTGILGMFFFCIALLKLSKELISNIRTHIPGSLGCLVAITVGMTNNLALSIIGEQWSPTTMVLSFFLALHIILNSQAIKQRQNRRVHRAHK